METRNAGGLWKLGSPSADLGFSLVRLTTHRTVRPKMYEELSPYVCGYLLQQQQETHPAFKCLDDVV
jgi:hypothetical protein